MASPDTGSRWKYLYQPLKADPPEMRLITLLPGPFSSQVQATLSTAPIHDPVSYEAISYAWGDPSTTAPILLDGIEFPITINLESALRHFRLEEKSRRLWADAICINQLDIQERNIQVRFMGDIYKRCSKCLIWLGEIDQDGDAVFDFIEDLAGGVCGLPGDALGPHPRILESLNKFLCRPWYDRMWVVQEAGLPPDAEFWCSRRMVNQRVVCVARQSFNNHWSKATEVSTSPKTLWLRGEVIRRFLNCCFLRCKPYELGRQKDNFWDGKWDLLRLMAACRTRSCTEPLDKVYALVGLVAEVWLSRLRVDYGISLQTLLTRIFVADIQISKSLRSLGLVWSNHLGSHTMPSWLPSWDTLQSDPLDYFLLLRYELYNASKSRLPEVEETSLAEGKLKFLTLLFDKVDILANARLTPDDSGYTSASSRISEEWTNLFMAHEQMRFGGSPWSWPSYVPDAPTGQQTLENTSYAAGGTALNAFWRTMVTDHVKGEVGPHSQLFRVDDTFEVPFWSMWNKGPGPDVHNKTVSSKAKQMQTAAYDSSFGRRFFITKNSYFGMGPRNMQQGDEIHIAAGGNCPLVLRPVNNPQSPSTNPRYTLVGDCYLHGIMDGEAADNFEERATMVEII